MSWPWRRTAPTGSLLTPGLAPHRLVRLDWLLLAALYLLAVAVRWGLRDANPYTAEATHFVVARGLWDSVVNIQYLDGIGGREDYSWFFWQRPLLTLPFWPFAQHSFLAYRTAHVLIVAAAPALGAGLLRTLGVGRIPAVAAAAVMAIHPVLLPWTVLFLPDALVLTMVLGALLLAHHGGPLPTALVLLAASWVKEVAFVASLTLLVLAVWRDGDGRRASLRPFRLGPFAWRLLPVVPLAFLPLYVSMHVPGAVFPGFRPGGDEALMYETLWGLVYLAPVPILALLSRATRRFALVAMAWPAFFLVYHYTQDKAIESWYNVLPASFTMLAAAAGLWALWRDGTRITRWGAPVLAVALALLLSIQITQPDHDELNARYVTPFSGRGQWDLEQVRDFELRRDDDLQAVMASVPDGERGTWVAQDVDWSLVMFPVAAEANLIVKVYSRDRDLTQAEMEGWAYGIEHLWNATLLFHNDGPAGNRATRTAYAECITTVGQYSVIRASQCQGAGSDIWERYQAELAR